jgi:glycosyltransferase involved in cell wall biosynthesis
MWMYRQYNAIIAISTEASELLKKYTECRFPVNIIPNGVVVNNYLKALPHEEFRSTGGKIIVMVAAFRPQKDQDTLIRAMQNLPTTYKLWLVGDGERRSECEQLAIALGIEKSVRFWGNRTDVPRLLKTADVVVMSTHYEGMSLSNIEGMASGRPFVASNVKGIREITEGAGVLFEEENDKQLAQIIMRLTTDRAYHDEVVQKCLARAKEFDVSKTAEGYLNVYRQLQNNYR